MHFLLSANEFILPKGARLRCAVGRNGIGQKQREGDGITPQGIWPLRKLLYREDQVGIIATCLPQHVIARNDIWIDDPNHILYNQHASLPTTAASYEKLWRKDRRYDLVIVVGFNDAPIVKGQGSAIFLHVADTAFTATAGCVALSKADLIHVLALCEGDDVVEIRA